jgi:CRP-like cAMP-binding protein
MLPRPEPEDRCGGGTIETMDQKQTHLSNVPLFQGLGPRELAQVSRLGDEVTVRAGKVLTKEGAPAHEFFVVLDGTVDISRRGKRVATLGPGDFFGELAMIGKRPRTATATASTAATLLVVAHREFISLLADHPSIRDKVLRAVATLIGALDPDRPN